MMKGIQSRSYAGIIALVLLFLAVNIVSTQLFRAYRVDLTDERLYTLSPASLHIIENIRDPLTMKFYFSATDFGGDLPGIRAYGERIRDLLESYARRSPFLKFEFYDVRSDTEEAEWAEKYGLSGLPRPGGDVLYCGLVMMNEMGEDAVIPFFDIKREEFLEYDISKTIFALTQTEKPVVGIYSPLSLRGAPASPFMPQGMDNEPWYFTMDLERIYDLRFLENLEEIDPEITLLVLLHPKTLSASAQYALDQFLMQGKNMFVAVDPFCEADTPVSDPSNPFAAMQQNRASILPQTLAHNGLTLGEDTLVLDRERATPVQMGPGQTANYYAWLSLTERDFNREDVVTGQLDMMLLPFVGTLQFQSPEGAGLEAIPLIYSSATAGTGSSSLLLFGGAPDRLVEAYQSGSEKLTLAYRLMGRLQSAFPDGAPPESPVDETHLSASQTPSQMIVIADTDFLQNRFSLNTMNFFGNILATPLNDNVNFFFNALESLTGSTELIQIRSRGRFSRPFERVRDIEARAESRWLSEEQSLTRKVEEANQKITGLMRREGEQLIVTDQAILVEIEKLREEKLESQSRLREVRRNLRREKEQLGTWLFLANTFAVPFLILLYGLTRLVRGGGRRV